MRFLAVPLLCLLAFSPVLAGKPGSRGKEAGRFADAEHWASIWETDERDEWQKPLTVLGFLGIEPGAHVADLGAGTGYLTGLLGIQVGVNGKVYAVDIEPSMLEYIEGREDFPLDRIETVLAAENDPRLPEGELDLIVTVNTWHHIKSRPKYLKKLAKALEPIGGRLAIIDFHAGELPVGPPAGHKLAREKVVAELEKARWDLVAESVALPYQYFLVFRPRTKEVERPFVERRK
jgi:ubiquinone/menaquinone biosynthesis C-methylase UbiE